jgi:hypothetical protein
MIFWVKGSVRNSHFSSRLTFLSGRGRIQGGVRWNRKSVSASGATAGTICIALAPVPMIATRLFSSENSWSQDAE